MTTERLGKYEIRGTLGKGAMGTVYSAWDPIISRTVAIKTVRLPDAADIDAQEELARFKREAQAAGRLTHPNIVGIFDYGETDQVAYIVMEFVEGRTLKSVLDANERMPVAAAGRIMADLLAGLRYSHERGVVHRDIKPANIMIVGGDGQNGGQAKIADFGIARIESSNLTQAGTIMGTPAYMSPEQFMGQTVDARTDIYSAGVLLFQLLTGERPFEGNNMPTIMHKALNTAPPKPSDLSVTAPVALDPVVAHAMARRPEDRYADAGTFAAAVADGIAGRSATPSALGHGLGDEFDGESTVVRPAGRPATPEVAPRPPAPPARARSKAPLLAGVAVLALAAAGAGAAWWSGLIGAPEPPNPQIAGSTRLVPTASGSPQTIVAVTPPSAPDTAAPLASANLEPSAPARPEVPAPIAGVTQVIPPTTAVADAPPPVAEVTQAAPPSAPTTRLTRQPAQVIPPALTPASQARPPEHPDIAPNTRLESAIVTPPAAATAVLPAIRPESVAPAPTAAAPAEPAIVLNPPVIATPSQARAPEPLVEPPPLAPAIVPVEPPAVPVTAPTRIARPSATVVPDAVPPTTVPPMVSQPPSTPPITTAAIVSPEALRRAVVAAVEGAECAAVRGDLTRAGTISMQGVVGRGGPVQDLLRHIRNAAPTAPLDWTVEEIEGPYCGPLNLVRAFTRPFGSVTGGMEIGLRDGRNRLQDDDAIEIRATAPDFPAYLQIDYFASDGTVSHLQTAAQGNPVLPARSMQSFVAGAVAAPFGTDLIVSIGSSVPLFGKTQPLSGDAEPYLRQLRGAIEAAIKRRAELAAGILAVYTTPKP